VQDHGQRLDERGGLGHVGEHRGLAGLVALALARQHGGGRAALPGVDQHDRQAE
jgi:hypothetical protein